MRLALKTSGQRKTTSKSAETQQWILLVARDRDFDQKNKC